MVVVGLVLLLTGRGPSKAGLPAHRRVGRLLLVAGAGLAVVALVMAWRATPHLRPVKELRAADVTEMRLGDWAIASSQARADIVDALHHTEDYSPEPAGHADMVLMTITRPDRTPLIIGLAESLGREGVVLFLFHDSPDESLPDGHGFNRLLSKSLIKAGFALPPISLRKQIQEFRAGQAGTVSVGDVTVSRPKDVEAIIQSLQTVSRMPAGRPRQFQQPVEITLMEATGNPLRIQAALAPSGAAAFWGLCQCPNGVALPYGFSLSYTLPEALSAAGVPLPALTK
jgi:hypothetical protein